MINDVLMIALLRKGITLKFWDRRNKNSKELLRTLKAPQCLGCIINTEGFFNRLFGFCFGENGHWVAIKKSKNGAETIFFDLNSNRSAPLPYSDEDVFEKFLLHQLRRNSHVLIATKTSSSEPTNI